MNVLQIFSKKYSPDAKRAKEIYFLRDNNNNIVGTTNEDLILAKIRSMSKDDIILIEKITEREYRDRVALEHNYNVLGSSVL